MHFTFHTRLNDATAEPFLDRMARMHCTIERKLYAQIAAGRFNNGPFKQAFCAKHALTSRQFNSMALEVKGKIAGVREALLDNIEILDARIKTLKATCYDLKRMLRSGVDAKGRKLGQVRIEVKKKSLHESPLTRS